MMISSQQIFQKISDSSRKLLFTILIFNIPFQFVLFYFLSDLNNIVKYEGDSIDYQTIAVNHSLGYGFMQEGYYENLSTYKFDIKAVEEIPVEEISRTIKTRNFLRNPVYPLMLSTIYQIVGINPFIVKVVQLFLLVLSSNLLIIIFWLIRSKGFLVKGIASSWSFILFEISAFFRTKDIHIFKRLLKITIICLCIISPYVVWQNNHFSNIKELMTLTESIVIAEKAKNSLEFYQKILDSKNDSLEGNDYH